VLMCFCYYRNLNVSVQLDRTERFISVISENFVSALVGPRSGYNTLADLIIDWIFQLSANVLSFHQRF